MRVERLIPDNELTDVALIERLKATYNEPDQSLYSRYVIHRGLKPRINFSEFRDIYISVIPDMHVVEEEVEFTPTHVNRITGLKTMIWRGEGGIWRIIDEIGSTGSYPPNTDMTQYYRKVED